MPNDLLTTAQVAERLGLSVYTINRYVRDGRIRAEMQMPGSKGARLYHPAEIDRFAGSLAVEAGAS
jgi:excisionase family DNA binding protein